MAKKNESIETPTAVIAPTTDANKLPPPPLEIIVPVYESERTIEIDRERDNLDGQIYAEKDHSKKDLLRDKSYKLGLEKNSIIAQLKLDERTELQRIARSEKIAKIDEMLYAYDMAMNHPEDLDLFAAYTAKRVPIENAVAGSVVSTVAKVKFQQGTVPNEGTKSARILELYKQNVAFGMTDTEARKSVVLAGYNDGTMGLVVKAYLDSLK